MINLTMREKINFITMGKDQKKKRERSVAYPRYSLSEVIEFSGDLRRSLGKGPYSRNEAAVALGYKGISGISATKISAMVHFGLLNRNGNTYYQSDLSERINHPLGDDDQKDAIQAAVLMPKLYKNLLGQFSGQALPTKLGNILIRMGISSKVSDSVAKKFEDSLEFSGFLQNGVILPEANLDTNKKANEQKSTESEIDTPFSVNTLPLPATPTNTNVNQGQTNLYQDSGNGWILTIKSNRTLTSDIKKRLIDVAEFLENGKPTE